MNENISVICSDSPKERIPLILNILKEYGINQHKRVYMQSFDVKTSYYVNHLISLVAEIDFRLVESYMMPMESKCNRKIDKSKFISAIEVLRDSDITINDKKESADVTWLNYVFDLSNSEPYQVIIIDNFNEFLDLSEESMRIIMRQIEKYSRKFNVEVILFMNAEDYDRFLVWKVAKANDPLVFNYDEHNHSILSIECKEKNNDKEKDM